MATFSLLEQRTKLLFFWRAITPGRPCSGSGGAAIFACVCSTMPPNFTGVWVVESVENMNDLLVASGVGCVLVLGS